MPKGIQKIVQRWLRESGMSDSQFIRRYPQREYAILSAHRSGMTASQSNHAMRSMRNDIHALGYRSAKHVLGIYDEGDGPKHERSFLVPGMTKQHAKHLATKYNQQSYIHHHPRTGIKAYTPDSDAPTDWSAGWRDMKQVSPHDMTPSTSLKGKLFKTPSGSKGFAGRKFTFSDDRGMLSRLGK